MNLLKRVSISFLMSLAAAALASAANRPNIILLIGDDLSWPHYGFMESEITFSNGEPVQQVVQTPSLDQMAAGGVVFEQGFSTSSICFPSLQTLLSARGDHWQQWLGLRGKIRAQVTYSELEREERRENRHYETLPRALARLGYRTWAGGKLWAGTFEDAGFSAGTGDAVEGPPYYESDGRYFGRAGWATETCGSTAAAGSTCPALDPLRDFLDGPSDAPFFLWVAPMLPHTPYDAASAYREPFVAAGLNSEEVDHLANIRWFDEVAGELLAELAARGILDNTLIIYAADNGWGLGFQSATGSGKGKGTLYDLGYRTPVIFYQPGQIPAGIRYPDLVSLADLPATILEYAGGQVPQGSRGLSLKERVGGGAPTGRSELALYDHYYGSAIVTDTWRYLRFNNGRQELYRIDLDPFEDLDLAADYPAVLADFRTKSLDAYAELTAAPSTREVSGWLEDISGQPVPGVALKLHMDGRRYRTLTGEGGWFSFTGFSDSEELELRAGPGVARLRSPDIEGDLVPLSFQGLVTSLVGVPRRPIVGLFGTRIGGAVRTPSGVAIAGARVRGIGRSGGRRFVVQTYSDAEGFYSFENLPVGPDFRVIATRSGYRRAKSPPISIDQPRANLLQDLVLPAR
jgi:arylsulfatase A-like enzyme